jgi:hypothetical protein
MAIETTRKTNSESLKFSYPKIMEGTGGLVVLFIDKKNGTVIKNRDAGHKDNYYKVGEGRSDWVESTFTDVLDDVVLRNIGD